MSYRLWGMAPRQALGDAHPILTVEATTKEDAEAEIALSAEDADAYEILLLLPQTVHPYDIYFDKANQPRVDDRRFTDYSCWMWVTMAGSRPAWVSVTLQNAGV